MNSDQAIDIREFLIQELIKNGFSDIVNEVTDRILEEENEEKYFFQNPKEYLRYFINETIDIFNNLSNKDHQKLIDSINEYITSEDTKIENISVELINQKNNEFINLKELPDYKEIESEFEYIKQELFSESEENDPE